MFALSLLAGCSAVGVYPIGEGALEGIELAADLWMPVYVSEDSETALTVVMVPGLEVEGNVVEGWAGDRRGCRRVAMINPDKSEPYTVAHEIGHLLMLGHSDDPENLMHHTAAGYQLTDAQRGKIERVADRLAMCWQS